MFSWLKRKPQDNSHITLDLDDEPVRPRKSGSTAQAVEETPEEVLQLGDLAAIEAIRQINEEERLLGIKYSPTQRANLLQMRGSQLALMYLSDYQRRQEMVAMRDSMDSLKDAVVNSKTKSVAESATDIWRDHPFLVGFFGADLVHRINKLNNN